jgi:hypothetical protein
VPAFVTFIGAAALSLTAALGHGGQTQTVSPDVASRGQVVRVALPSKVPAPADLVATIRVAGAKTRERPTRATGRYVWVRVDVPTLAGPAGAAPSGTLEARLTLASDHRRILATTFELRTGGPRLALPTGPAQPPAVPKTETAPGTEAAPVTEPAPVPEPEPEPEPVPEPVAELPEVVPAPEPPTGGPPAPEAPAPLPPPESTDRLNWAPPTLTAPTVVTVPDGRDPAVLRLSTARDYVVKLPPEGIHGTLEINGGHNVDLIGGQITVPATANQADNGADDTDTALYVRAATGTVHIEGVLIEADAGTQFDGIDINAPLATVQVENVRMEDVYGTRTAEHADVIQTWGGVKELDVDDLTANGDYQGLTVAPALGIVGNVNLDNVDITAEAAPPSLKSITVGGGIMLWLTRGITTCESPSVTLQDVYIANLTGRIDSANTVWPSPASRLSCDPVVAGEAITWPGLPVSGQITTGRPPGGSFVPEGVAGNAYVSPGYQPF